LYDYLENDNLVTTNNIGYIQGNPGANTAGTYLLTVTATDSAPVPVTGTWTFTLTVVGGLVVNGPTSTTTRSFNDAPGTITLSAIGGAYPYHYAITSTAAVGITMPAAPLDTTGILTISSATMAGTYTVVVTATDSAGVTGVASFTVVVNPVMSKTTLATVSHTDTGLTVTTVSTTGLTGDPSGNFYTWDATNSGNAGFVLDPSTGIITATSVPAATYNLVVKVTDTATAVGATGKATSTLPITVIVN
jgi:hypothetical protein